MCGVILSVSKKPTFENVLKVKAQFIEQKHRGVQGFGYVAIQNGQLRFVRSTKQEDIFKDMDTLGETTFVMFHHRIPTCNLNAVKTNHPIPVRSKKNLEFKYYMIHNGAVENSDSLREEHEKAGFRYRTAINWKYQGGSKVYENEHTDSESLAIELALFIEGKSNRIKCRGRAAVFMLQTDQDNRPIAVYYFRHNAPIKFFQNQHSIFFASESKGLEVMEQILYRLDLNTWKVTEKPARLSGVSDMGIEFPHIPFQALVKTSDITPPPVNLPGKDQADPNTLVLHGGFPQANRPRITIKELYGDSKNVERRLDVLREEEKSVSEKLNLNEGDLMSFEETFGDDHLTEEKQKMLQKKEVLEKRLVEIRDILGFAAGVNQ